MICTKHSLKEFAFYLIVAEIISSYCPFQLLCDSSSGIHTISDWNIQHDLVFVLEMNKLEHRCLVYWLKSVNNMHLLIRIDATETKFIFSYRSTSDIVTFSYLIARNIIIRHSKSLAIFLLRQSAFNWRSIWPFKSGKLRMRWTKLQQLWDKTELQHFYLLYWLCVTKRKNWNWY